jgi:flagellar hook-associated protein 2
MVDQLRAVENQRLNLLAQQKGKHEAKLSAWQSYNDKLSSLQSAASNLKSAGAFNLFGVSMTSSSSTVTAASLLTVTASSSAAEGTYDVTITNKAQVEKLASQSYTSKSDAVGVSGAILVNGHAVNISNDDSLEDIRTAINQVNTGDEASQVVASIIQESASSYRLVLTSETEGAAGLSLLNGSSGDVLGSLGFNSSGTALKNQATGGARSDRFTSASTAVDSLLGNESQVLSGNVIINGIPITISLSDSLSDIKDALVGEGISARLVTETEGLDTYYSLEVEGMTSWTDGSNVLQSLGIIEGKRDDVIGVKSGTANTTDGQTAITSGTLITNVYGYLNQDAADTISISGKKHDGSAVSTSFAIDGTKTVGDLMTAVQSAFGNVTASVTSDGKIQVVDNDTGTSQLSVGLTANLNHANPGNLSFGTFTDVGTVRSYVLQQGRDASFTVDGMQMTSSSNTVTDAIPGLTLNLLGQSEGTTVSVNVDRDNEGIKEKLQSVVDAYNGVMDFVNAQMTYDTETRTTGGALFGDTLLKSIKTNLQSTLVNQVWGTTSLTALSSIGITMGENSVLEVDSSILDEKLQTNFDDVVKLFSNNGASANNNLSYVYSSRDSQQGTYAVDITQTATKATISGSGIVWTGGYGGATGDEITITDSASGKAITKTFKAAESLSDISAGLNSLLHDEGMEISTSVDGSGQLQISQNNYGSGKSFTLSYVGGAKASLGITDPDDTADGSDVAGDIGGIPAVGSGQILEMEDTTSTAVGLQIKYTGTATGAVGDFTFTRGVASLLEGQLYKVTDSIDGTLTIRQNGVQTSIDQMEDKIETTQDQIDRKMAALTKRFQAMETALSQMQAMQSYLNAQLGSLG